MKSISILMMLAALILTPTRGWSKMTAITQSNNQFAFDLFNQPSLAAENTFFSPLSIGAALAMTSAGAQKETLGQMTKVLHLPSKPHPQYKELLSELRSTKSYQLLIANRIWGERSQTYKPQFISTLKENYQAEVGQQNFHEAPEEARFEINKWISNQTENKIPELFKKGDLDSDTDLVLTNAIYFKGTWNEKFETSETKDQDFFIKPEQKKAMPFMHKTATFAFAEHPDFQMLEMPYQDDELSFIAMLPVQGKELGAIDSKQFQALSQSLAKIRVQVEIPKFRADSSLQMKDLLSQMGMPLAFDEAKANFHGMRKLKSGENLFLSKVIHQAVVEINEEGTEAAAATGVVASVRMSAMMPKKPIVVRLDRPFAYFILHKKTGALLFMGRFTGT